MTSQRKTMPHETDSWNGYTLDELRYQRAYTAARMEIQRHGLQHNIANINLIDRSKGKFGGVLGTLFNSLSYIDIGIFAFKMGRRVFKTVRRLRR